METVSVKVLRPGAKLPTYGTDFAAGADLYACLEGPVTLAPGETALIPTGLAMAIPAGYAGLVYARSGISVKRGLAPANKVGVIDSDYRGECTVALYNQSAVPQTVEPGERIAQLVVTACLRPAFAEAEALDETVRGAGGFGSTGTK